MHAHVHLRTAMLCLTLPGLIKPDNWHMKRLDLLIFNSCNTPWE